MWLNRQNPSRHQRRNRDFGFTLIEALVSLLVLATGLIVMANFQGRVTTSSIDAKARSEAMQLAQQRMEWLRARDLAEDMVFEPKIGGQVADYTLSLTLGGGLTLEDEPLMRAATVRVDWTSSRDEPQWVELLSYVSANAYAGSVNPGSGVEFFGGSVAGPGGGARMKRYDPADIPSGAVKDFGNIKKLDPNDEGNIEFINTDTGEAIEILTPHRAAYIAGAVYARTDRALRPNYDDLSQDVFVRATPISLCGYDATETGGNFEYYPYRCYLAASDKGEDQETFGWYGNVGILHPAATNQDGVCVGSLTPATALPASVRQYRGYETRDKVCEADTTDCGKVVGDDGAPLLFPVGITGVANDILRIEDHNFLVARIGNNPSAANCAESMEGAPPVDSEPFADNPPEFFCFSDDPALCPDRTFGVAGPEGCSAVGAVCDADGKAYHGLVYAGAAGGFYYFTSREDESAQSWGASADTCTGKGTGWLLGGVREVHDLLHLNYDAFRTRPEGVSDTNWSLPLEPVRYWTRDQHNANRGLFVDIVGGASGNMAKTETYVSRCLFTAPRQ